jgi:hypothetical protein
MKAVDKSFTFGRLSCNLRITHAQHNSYSLHIHFWWSVK